MKRNRLLAVLCAGSAFVALSGCGGGAGSPAVPPHPQAPALPTTSPGSGMSANAVLVITIPPKTSMSSSSRKPAYVSPSTQSIAVRVDSGTPTTQNLTPGSPNCSVPAPLAPLTCTVPIAAAAGAHTFTFTTYDQTGGAGNQLSLNSVTQTLTANQVDTINVTLAGVPKSIAVAPLYNATGVTGDQNSGFTFFFGVPQTVSVTAMDADGNFIVGPGAPVLSVSVTGATPGAGIAAAPASNGNPNDFTLQSTSAGTATLAITATPASGLAGAALTANVQVNPTTSTTTLAGSELAGSAGYLDGTGSGAKLGSSMNGIAYDSGNGNLYLTDTGNCAIRQVTPAGAVHTIAGQYPGVKCNYQNGTGTNAWFKNPAGIAYDSADGNLYVTDTGNCTIRQVSIAGVVVTFAGSLLCGNANGTGATAAFNGPKGIAYDPADGDLYVTDTGNCEIRRVTAGGVVSTLAGSTTCGSADGTGSAAQFNSPQHLAYDSANGDLYVTDSSNCEIRQVTTAGVVTTIAGTTTCNFADGTGSAAQFNTTLQSAAGGGITYDSADGNLYVTDTDNQIIRQVTPSGVVSTISGTPLIGKSGCTCVDGVGALAYYDLPTGLVFDPATGSLYVIDKANHVIRQVQI